MRQFIREREFPMVKALLLSLLDIWLPSVCSCCRHPLSIGSDRKLCNGCFAAVEFMRSPICICCGAGLNRDGGSEDRFCGQCLRQAPFFDTARSFVYYQEPASTLLIKLKFQADTRAAASIGRLISQVSPKIIYRSYDLIVPVPLHHTRLRKRGLNQSLILARLMFGDYRKNIVPTGLIRVKNSVAQTKLSGRKRRRNLINAFSINPHVDVAGKAVCVVDDVFTTGTTVSECAKTLKKAGACRVDVWTFARA